MKRSAALLRSGQSPFQREIDINHFGNLKDKDARVFQPPLNVRNSEVSLGRESRSFNVNLHGHGQLMRSAMEGEDAGNLNGRITRCRDSSLKALGRKRNFGKVSH